MKGQKFYKLLGNVSDKYINEAEGVKKMQKQSTGRPAYFKWAAAFLLVVGVFTAVFLNMSNSKTAVAATITLDINPSLEITVNNADKVVEVKPLNEDGVKIIGDMKFEGVDLEITISALLGSMMKHDYLTDDNNTLLVGVKKADGKDAEELRKKVQAQVEAAVGTDDLKIAVVTQEIKDNKETREQAAKLNISVNKMELIDKILEIIGEERYNAESLAAMSVHELNMWRQSHQLELPKTESSGQSNDNALIGMDAARSKVLEYWKLSANQVLEWEIEVEFENGQLLYEIEFKTADAEYEADVVASTGQIVKAEKDLKDNDDDGDDDDNDIPAGLIGKERAKMVALMAAGVDMKDVRKIEIELDEDDDVYYYEVELEVAGAKFEIEVDARSGKGIVVKQEVKIADLDDDDDDDDKVDLDDDDDDDDDDDKGIKLPELKFSVNNVRDLALKDAGLDLSLIRELKIELDEDDGVFYYKIEFKYKDVEYEYEIHAVTGKILKKDIDD